MKKCVLLIIALILTATFQEPTFCESANIEYPDKDTGYQWWLLSIFVARTLSGSIGAAIAGYAILIAGNVCLDNIYALKYGYGVNSSTQTIKRSPQIMELIDQIPVGEGIQVPITILKVSNNTVVEIITIPGVVEGANTVFTVFTILS